MHTKLVLSFVALASVGLGQQTDFAQVISRPVSRTVDLPAEFQPYLSVLIKARVPGYVERVLVDRGSNVKQGQTLAILSAPEMKAQLAEASSKVEAAEADRVQAEAQLAALRSTAGRLQQASETPGAISGNELLLARKQVESAQAAVRSHEQKKKSVEASLLAQKDLERYLTVTAPFAGIITERFLHPGALVAPGDAAGLVMLAQISRLRLVVPVPEQDTGGTRQGAHVTFKVPAYPDRVYQAVVARSSHTVDQKTRTMAVELDVVNRDGSLSPGMYPLVKWPVSREKPALLVPKTSVVTTTERTFVIRSKQGRAEWVNVGKGSADGDLVEVTGSLQAGDRVLKRATDEIREGASLAPLH